MKSTASESGLTFTIIVNYLYRTIFRRIFFMQVCQLSVVKANQEALLLLNTRSLHEQLKCSQEEK